MRVDFFLWCGFYWARDARVRITLSLACTIYLYGLRVFSCVCWFISSVSPSSWPSMLFFSLYTRYAMIFEINSFYDMHRASNETTKMRNKLNEMTHFVFIQLFLFRFFAPLMLRLTFCVLHGKNVPLHDKKMYRLATISRFGLALLHMWKIRALRFEPYSIKPSHFVFFRPLRHFASTHLPDIDFYTHTNGIYLEFIFCRLTVLIRWMILTFG